MKNNQILTWGQVGISVKKMPLTLIWDQAGTLVMKTCQIVMNVQILTWAQAGI